MKRSKLAIWSIPILVTMAFAGCSNTVTTPTNNTQVSYTKGDSYGYHAFVLNATSGQPSGTTDTITSTIAATDGTFDSMVNVTTILNSHTHPASGTSLDTTYISQNNGNFYHYNYGLEALNNDAAVLAIANSGKSIEVGWVLQAKLSANSGDKWIGVNDTLSLNSPTLGGAVTAYLTDNVTEEGDTTISVNNSPVVTKHSVHNISLSIPGSFSAEETVDTYVSVADGTVLNIDHPTSLVGSAAPGLETIFIGKVD
ncbi:MAG TPA: hypothetical protein VGM92_02750 [Candidatus Kapabacteria bacterium]